MLILLEGVLLFIWIGGEKLVLVFEENVILIVVILLGVVN